MPRGGVTGWLEGDERLGEMMLELHLLRGACGASGASAVGAMAARREAARRTRNALEVQRRREAGQAHRLVAEERQRENRELEAMVAEDLLQEEERARRARQWREERAGKHTKMDAEEARGGRRT